MSEALNYYLSVNGLLLVSLGLLKLLAMKELSLDARSRLKLSYLFVAASVMLPLAFVWSSAENPFGPIVKVWQQGSLEQSAVLQPQSINFQLLSTSVTPSFSWAWSEAALTIAALFALVVLLISGVRLCQSLIRLHHLLSEAVLIKKIGKTKLWVSDQVCSPFSYFFGSAHVVLPYEAVVYSRVMRIAVAHELQHHRQKDTLWVYVLKITKVLFAPNLAVHKLVGHIYELQEFACDEALIKTKSFSPHSYGKCLYDFAKNQMSKQAILTGAVGMAVETSTLTRRIEVMFENKKRTPTRVMLSLLALGLVTLSCAAWSFRGAVSDQSITMSKAQKLASAISTEQEIPIVVDSRVLYWLNKAVSSEKSRKYMSDSLERMKVYQPMIENQLKGAGLPAELLAVPLVESGYRTDVFSTASAAGLWQFIPQTARRCGLTVNEENDERLDAGRLTEAAVCYYQKLHAIFQDWHVALAAYNVGERRMMNTIADASHNDVLKLSREGKLGREGGNYLPKVLAGMILMRNPELVQ